MLILRCLTPKLILATTTTTTTQSPTTRRTPTTPTRPTRPTRQTRPTRPTPTTTSMQEQETTSATTRSSTNRQETTSSATTIASTTQTSATPSGLNAFLILCCDSRMQKWFWKRWHIMQSYSTLYAMCCVKGITINMTQLGRSPFLSKTPFCILLMITNA